jgi:hypothetical protein
MMDNDDDWNPSQEVVDDVLDDAAMSKRRDIVDSLIMLL